MSERRPGCVDDHACLTCGDVAVVAEVVSLDGCEALVRVEGEHETVAVDLVPDAAPGDRLLCHAGVALARVEGSVEEGVEVAR